MGPRYNFLDERSNPAPSRMARQHVDFQKEENLVELVGDYPCFSDSSTPDMVPLIIDTGAIISIAPFKAYFGRPVHVKTKGIASGLLPKQ